MTVPRKIAMILRGPVSAGKTTFSKEAVNRFDTGTARARHISLDHGWGPAEPRYSPGPMRYADIRDAPEPLLVIELGCGEPSNLSFDGAMRGASEWIDILRAAGREIFSFLLWIEWEEMLERVVERSLRENPKTPLYSIWNGVGVYALYAQRHPYHTLPEAATIGIREVIINASKQRSKEAITDEILRSAGLIG